jgi:hypothetical protein
MGSENIAEGEQAERLAVMRVDGDGPLEQRCVAMESRHMERDLKQSATRDERSAEASVR